MLFLVIFEDDKSGTFLSAPSRAKSRTNDVTSKYHLRHFWTSQKVKTDIFVNVHVHVIYRGYSNFLLNMAFISPSEVENIYIS